MSLGFLNLALLAGLAAMAIPPIIHFLNRRRHDVVDWGAMQFLLVSPARRRRFMIEEWLLMALRMGLIALMVLAFAAPYVSGSLVAGWTRPPRDTVLVLDGSYSMERSDGKTPTAWQQARTWCDDWLKQAHAGDRVAVLLSSSPPQSWVGELTADSAGVRNVLEQLPRPTGNADWPRAAADAWDLLRDRGQAARRDIILVTDRQKFGWADPATLGQWQSLGRRLQSEREARKDNPQFAAPALWAVTLGEGKAGPNLRMAPLQTARTVAGVGQRLRFTTALHWDNFADERPPKKIEVRIDNETRELSLPARLQGASGHLPLSFEHRFKSIGVHLVSVMVEPDESQDVLPADNHQNLVMEIVQELSVLLIDGAEKISPESATFYLAKAFADPSDKARVSFVTPRVVTHGDLDPETLLAKVSPPPRVVVLADVPRLTEPQLAGLTRFVSEGGGLLVCVGPRTQQAFYNDQLYAEGKGLLPARLDGIETVKSEQSVTLDVKRFLHPALELFREEPNCTLGQAGYTRWWKATAASHGKGATVALFANDDPWLIEKTHGQGRVLLSTLPMDRSWDGHLPKTWEFPVLAHELLFALADVRIGGFNLQPGQTLRIQAASAAAPASVTLHRPDGSAATRTAATWPFAWNNPGPPGVYHVQVGDAPRWPVVVHADPRESDLTPCTEEERREVAQAVALRYLEETTLPGDVEGAAQTQEVWWLFLIGAIGLLCGELWLTRRMAIARGRN
jgi:Aerotolerance regulator N-terminal/von Willebrand factor type A domain